MGTSEESGKDWSELEEEAREADKEFQDTDEIDRRKRLQKTAPKHKSPHKSSHGSSKRRSDRDDSRHKHQSKKMKR